MGCSQIPALPQLAMNSPTVGSLDENPPSPPPAILTSREIDSGWSARLEESEATIDNITRKVGDPRILQIDKKSPPLKGFGKFA